MKNNESGQGAVGLLAGVVAVLLIAWGLIWLVGSSNVETSAGNVGYVTQGAVFGKDTFHSMQTGPTSSGKIWLLHVQNVSITPYTYSEDFAGDSCVLSKDNLKISFSVHTVWKVKKDRVKDFVENYSATSNNDHPDKVVMEAYKNFLREPLRTYARDEIQKLDGLAVKDRITPIGEAILKRVKELTDPTPFEVDSIVVGNIQYPSEVAEAVAKKMATTQILEQKETELQIEKKKAAIRIADAEGVAKAMDIIQVKLTPQYLQHEAIEAQKMMVGSPNHTTVYIPVGNMGVPLVGTFDAKSGK